MSKTHDVIAILCSDIHLSSRAPIARSAEKCWFAAMERQLKQLRNLKDKYECPVVCAGDIFDRWNSTPELINFALDKLPEMYAVPGQHDLPEHSMDEVHRSAYWTLVQSGLIQHLDNGRRELGDLALYGYGWGQKIEPVLKRDRDDKQIKLAVVHRYCWYKKGTCYPGAPEEGKAVNLKKELKGYDAAVFGDNHITWFWEDEAFLNPGSFFRRRIDEVRHQPVVGLLYKGGYIVPCELDCSEDKFIDVDEGTKLIEKGLDLTELVDDLKSLGNGTLDFVETLFQYMDKNGISKSVRKLITKSMEKDRLDGSRSRKQP